MPMMLRLTDLRLDGGSQLRVQLDETAIADYVETLKTGSELPAIDVVDDNDSYWLANGFHRHEAHRRIGRDEIACEVKVGTRIDAIRFAARSNTKHGVRLTDDDKRNKVRFFLDHLDELAIEDNDSAISRACLVSRSLIAAVRAERADLSCRAAGYEQAVENIEPESSPPPDRRIVRRRGQEYPITTPRPRAAEPELVPLTFESSKRAAAADREKALKESDRYREKREAADMAVVDGALAWFDKASTDRRLSFVRALMDKLTDAERWQVIHEEPV